MKATLKRSILQTIYPRWLREKLYFHLILPRQDWPDECTAFSLEFAPTSMRALLRTDLAHRQIAWLGFYELGLSRTISRLAADGGLLIDVGANAGYFSCLWATIRPDNEVFAFEPVPRNLAMLRENVVALSDPERIRVFAHALGKTSGSFAFEVGPIEQSGWGGLASAGSEQTIQVEVRRLDEVVPADKPISVLKIDTEGADTWVLQGAEALLRRKMIRHIFFEANAERMKQLQVDKNEARSFLESVGYSVSLLESGSVSEFHATPAGLL